MQDFKRLRVAMRARNIIRTAYEFTRTLPGEERFGLTGQIRRAAISMGLNIAEGCSRSTTREFIRFLEIARGSGMELEFAYIVTEDLNIGTPGIRVAAAEELDHGQRELSALIRAMRKRQANRP